MDIGAPDRNNKFRNQGTPILVKYLYLCHINWTHTS